jgi:hypothetical protein
VTDTPKGRFTFRFAAVCFGLSAAAELLSLGDAALLFGAEIGGTGAAIYHLAYAALFAWLAGGLWSGWRSAYYTLIATTVLYTVDRVQLVAFRDALEASIRRLFTGHEDILAAINMGELLQILNLMIAAFVLCWWGFVAYACLRRAYFGIR